MAERTRPSSADQDGLTLPARPDTVIDVHFGDQRVFSAAPRKFSVRGGRARLDWPKALRPHLSGSTRLVVKEHLSGEVLLDEQIRLGDTAEPISVTDREGRPLAVDKFGALVRMFSETDESTAHHLAGEVARLAGDVNDFGVPGFLAYGSLLGAVRNGRLIGHDTDTDMAYLSRHTHPADITRESFALERFLVDRGWTMARMRVGLIRAVFRDEADDVRHIDIFTATHDGTHLYLDPFVHAALPLSALVPLGTVTFEGVEIPAPADPAAILAATYGPSYLVPDPSFSYHPPQWLRRRSLALMGNYRLRRAVWQRRMRRAWEDKQRPEVSTFAKRVAAQEPADATIVDVGCGMGSDALWFARTGHRVIGIDYADPPLRYLRTLAERRGLPAEFRALSLYDVRATLASAARLAGEPDDLVLYARHLLDVLEPEGRTNFWLLARTALLRGGRLYLRFRTQGGPADVEEPGFRALDPDLVLAEAAARGARLLSRTDDRRATTLVLAWGDPAGDGERS